MKAELAFLFTFHHVSIKTAKIHFLMQNILDLHSTMYLLKRKSDNEKVIVSNTFTFHHVSIKTG